MDFERLFTFFIIMIIWGASNILRKKAKPDSGKQASAAQKPGLLKIMQQHLAALEEKSQEEESITFDEYFQAADEPQADELQAEEHEKKSLIDMAVNDSRQQEPSITGRETVSAAAPKRVAKIRPTILQKKPAMTNRRKLQNAVIWAEILAPPVAMRDQ